jgi:hypothetical protein
MMLSLPKLLWDVISVGASFYAENIDAVNGSYSQIACLELPFGVPTRNLPTLSGNRSSADAVPENVFTIS